MPIPPQITVHIFQSCKLQGRMPISQLLEGFDGWRHRKWDWGHAFRSSREVVVQVNHFHPEELRILPYRRWVNWFCVLCQYHCNYRDLIQKAKPAKFKRESPWHVACSYLSNTSCLLCFCRLHMLPHDHPLWFFSSTPSTFPSKVHQ